MEDRGAGVAAAIGEADVGEVDQGLGHGEGARDVAEPRQWAKASPMYRWSIAAALLSIATPALASPKQPAQVAKPAPTAAR